MSTLTTTSPLYTPEEAAEYLKGNQRTLERWRSAGGGPRFVKMGRAVRYRLADLDAWLEQQTREHTGAPAAPAA